jgi:hypothetical protein
MAPQMDFTFSNFSLVLPFIRGTLVNSLEFSFFWLAEIQANTIRDNPPKTELWYLQTEFSINFSIKAAKQVL